jgi:hypothetical protein
MSAGVALPELLHHHARFEADAQHRSGLCPKVESDANVRLFLPSS